MIDRFAQLPTSLRANARWLRLGAAQVPVMLVVPPREADSSLSVEPEIALPPIVLWMHGRTVNKELDPGRYLRWMRAGIAVCAIDLPGHGERFDAHLQLAASAFDVVKQMIDEIDAVVEALRALGEFDMHRLGVGGVSAGGMAALARLCQPHDFRCASVESTTGSWSHHAERAMFRDRTAQEIAALNPIENLQTWREIPLQALHAQHDEWVPIERQQSFIEALRKKYRDPTLIDFHIYQDRTGAPNEHQGFGKMSADAKDRQRDFFRRALTRTSAAPHV